MEVVPLSPLIAAEVRGLDVSAELDATTLRELHEAWFAHLVLVFRGQRLSDEALVRFSRHFGELELAPIGDAANPKSDGTVPNMPEVIVVSNVVEDGVAIGVLGAGEAIWHHRHVLHPGAAVGESPLRARGAAQRRRHEHPQHVRGLRGAAAGFADQGRAPGGEARRESQLGGKAAKGIPNSDRREPGARRKAPDAPHAPGDRPQGALSGPAPQRLCRRSPGRGERTDAR